MIVGVVLYKEYSHAQKFGAIHGYPFGLQRKTERQQSVHIEKNTIWSKATTKDSVWKIY